MKKKKKKLKKSLYRNIPKTTSLKKILIESITVLFISVIGESITGSVLVSMKQKLILIPGLIVIIPALTDLRGNVGAAFGERLSTMLHLGILKPHISLNRVVKHNILASFSLTITIAFIIGAISPVFSYIFHIKNSGPMVLSFISVTAGFISSIILLPIVFIIVLYAFRKNIDPDNIIAPTLPVIGDIVTVSAIYFAAMLVLKINKQLVYLGFIMLALLLFTNGFKNKNSHLNFPDRYHYLQIIKQSIPVLLVCLTIGLSSGMFLQSAEKTFDLFPILLSIVPQVVAQGGSIGGIVGSRVSTALYLGTVKPFKFNNEISKDWIAGVIMGAFTGPAIGIVASIVAVITKTPVFSFYKILIVSSSSLLILSILMSIIATYISFISFRIHLDPSNVVIPIITSLGDITGVLILLLIVKIVIL